eukprot:jgi/Tetstr1/465195/TSEL_009902.t1
MVKGERRSARGDAALGSRSCVDGVVGVPKQQHKRAGGIIKHNTNAVKSLAATQAAPGDNVDEGSSPEPSAKKANHPANPADGVPAHGRGGAGAMAGEKGSGDNGLGVHMGHGGPLSLAGVSRRVAA